MSDSPSAVVREVNGQLVLDDPAALGAIAAIEAHNRGEGRRNCWAMFDVNAERIAHFARRIEDRGLSVDEVAIVVLDVDDVHGGAAADALMPNNGAQWAEIRSRGEKPIARGLAARRPIQELLEVLDRGAGDELRALAGVPAVVVMTSGVQMVFAVSK